MLEETVKDYTAYIKLDVSGELKSVQDVIDNMLTRLEELTSVLQIIRSKNNECGSSVSEDIIRYRAEIMTLSKKINTINEVIVKVHSNVDMLEKHVEKAEIHFSVSPDNKVTSFLKPFFKKSNTPIGSLTTTSSTSINFESVINHFNDSLL